MIRWLSATAFMGALILAGDVVAGPMEDAQAAFEAGDYARALSLWRWHSVRSRKSPSCWLLC